MDSFRISPFSFCWLLWLVVSGGRANAEATSLTEKGDRPNILWITSEDNAAHWLGCYGNIDAQTPRLDALANESILFNHAYSNAPVCAVARSTILHGVYAVSTGTQHMRSRHPIPASFKPYVNYLRELGYYCTNRSKTDYNCQGDDQAIWDACDWKAHYKNRNEGQPFFAIFNLTVSHESSLFPQKVAENRKKGIIPNKTRLSAGQLQLPPYLPDLPDVRSDFAIYHDTITALDKQVGSLLDELEERGLAENTIVFYFADHGGATPRGKRYLTDTGVRVPMIVYMPKKWQRLSPFQPGERVSELVSFIDLAPTLLSLCEQDKPSQMQGRAFLGSHRAEPEKDPVVFLFADRFDELYGMRRGITDGRFKYIRRFTPHLCAAPCSNYSLSQPGWSGWQKAWRENKLPVAHRKIWEAPQAVEELYDLEADPWEVTNLANDPAHKSRLAIFRERLKQKMLDVQDTGVIPEPMFKDLAGDGTICDFVRSDLFDRGRVLQKAMLASQSDSASLPAISEMLADKDPVVRYWGALGSTILGEQAMELASQLALLGEDESPCIRMTAAQALVKIGKEQAGKKALLREFDKRLNNEEAILLMNLTIQLDYVDDIPQNWIDGIVKDENVSVYIRRFIERITQ